MTTYEAAIAKLETKRGAAPAAQQPAIDLALTMLRRAAVKIGSGSPFGGESFADFACRQVQSNDECNSPARGTAEVIIGKLLG